MTIINVYVGGCVVEFTTTVTLIRNGSISYISARLSIIVCTMSLVKFTDVDSSISIAGAD